MNDRLLANIFLVLVTAVASTAAAGCQLDSEDGASCTGMTTTIDGRDYCAYQRSEITETGFDCPASHPHRHDAGDAVVCANSDEAMPEDHKQRVQDELDNRPDDGDTPGDGDDNNSGDDEPCGFGFEPQCEVDPPCCEGQNRTLAGGVRYTDAVLEIPWNVYRNSSAGIGGQEDERLDLNLEGTWKGTAPLDDSVSVDCPTGAGDLGLPCQVDWAAEVETTNGNTVELVIGLPKSAVDSLPTGTEVTVSGRYIATPTSEDLAAASSEALWIEEKATSDPLIGLEDESYEYGIDHGPLSFSPHGFEQYTSDKAENLTAAVCKARFHPGDCDEMFRLDRLDVETDAGTDTLGPVSNADVTVDSRDYRVWHVATVHHYDAKRCKQDKCAQAFAKALSVGVLYQPSDD